LKVRSSPLLLGASVFTLPALYPLVASQSAMMVSEKPASEDGDLEERLRGGKPSSRSGRPGMHRGSLLMNMFRGNNMKKGPDAAFHPPAAALGADSHGLNKKRGEGVI